MNKIPSELLLSVEQFFFENFFDKLIKKHEQI